VARKDAIRSGKNIDQNRQLLIDRKWLEAIPKAQDLQQLYKPSSRKDFANVMMRANDKNLLGLQRSDNFLKPESAKNRRIEILCCKGWPYVIELRWQGHEGKDIGVDSDFGHEGVTDIVLFEENLWNISRIKTTGLWTKSYHQSGPFRITTK